jgi:transposase
MGTMGQTFEKTFKQEAVRLVQTSGKSQRQVAEDLGVAMSTLSRWCTEMATNGEQAFVGSGNQQHAALAEQGIRIGRKRVVRLSAHCRTHRVVTTKANPLARATDNAVMERFFGTLKREGTSRAHFKTHEEARTTIFE